MSCCTVSLFHGMVAGRHGDLHLCHVALLACFMEWLQEDTEICICVMLHC